LTFGADDEAREGLAQNAATDAKSYGPDRFWRLLGWRLDYRNARRGEAALACPGHTSGYSARRFAATAARSQAPMGATYNKGNPTFKISDWKMGPRPREGGIFATCNSAPVAL